MVLHDINFASTYGDFFIGMTKNRQIIAKEKNEFINENILNEIFGIKFKVIANEAFYNIQILN